MTIHHINFATGQLEEISHDPFPIGTRILVRDKRVTITEQGDQQDCGIYDDGSHTTVMHDVLKNSPQIYSLARQELATPSEVEALIDLNRKFKTSQREKCERERFERAERKKAAQLIVTARPNWAVSYIVAELVADESDSMTDYYGHSITRRIALAWSKHNRNLFPEMRKAAALLSRLDGIEWQEHRDNHSMGGGMFLSEKRGSWSSQHTSGWKISKCTGIIAGYFNPEALLDPLAFPKSKESKESKPDPVVVDSVTFTLNDDLNGVEISFPVKPSDEIRTMLKKAGFKWSRRLKIWYSKQTQARIDLARSLSANG